jgi:signal transduction histidine kinase
VLLIAEWNTEETIQTVFEPGFTLKKGGWGLGLSLTKKL